MTVNDVFNQAILKVQEPTCSIFEAVAAVQNVIVSHLLFKRSDLLLGESPVRLTFAAEQGRKILPDEVLDIAGRPVLESGRRLKVLAGREEPVTEPGAPVYYRLLGKQLRIYPLPDAETKVQVPVYVRPDLPEEMDDELPFYGMFDHVFTDACVAVLRVGTAAVADKVFATMIQSQVDGLLTARELSAEQLAADSINQEALGDY